MIVVGYDLSEEISFYQISNGVILTFTLLFIQVCQIYFYSSSSAPSTLFDFIYLFIIYAN